MIVPNLMVTDMARSVAFYRDAFAMEPTMLVSGDRQILGTGHEADAVFATLEWDTHMLMLQTAESLSEELPVFDPQMPKSPAGTIYFRGMDPVDVASRVDADRIVAGPVQQWYGMKEVYVKDPDGHILCAGIMEGTPED